VLSTQRPSASHIRFRLSLLPVLVVLTLIVAVELQRMEQVPVDDVPASILAAVDSSSPPVLYGYGFCCQLNGSTIFARVACEEVEGDPPVCDAGALSGPYDSVNACNSSCPVGKAERTCCRATGPDAGTCFTAILDVDNGETCASKPNTTGVTYNNANLCSLGCSAPTKYCCAQLSGEEHFGCSEASADVTSCSGPYTTVYDSLEACNASPPAGCPTTNRQRYCCSRDPSPSCSLKVLQQGQGCSSFPGYEPVEFDTDEQAACNAYCNNECGDGTVQWGVEECEPGNLSQCAYHHGEQTGFFCREPDTEGECTCGWCGDGARHSAEACEGTDVGGCGTPPSGKVYVCQNDCSCKLCAADSDKCASNADCEEGLCNLETCNCGAECGDGEFDAAQEECDGSSEGHGDAYCEVSVGEDAYCIMGEIGLYEELNCTCSRCGNNSLDSGEECEYSITGNPSYDGDAVCAQAHPSLSEDLGASYCDECKCFYCGDSRVDTFNGEECETAQDCAAAYPDLDTSTAQCEGCLCTHICGNYITEDEEQCDIGGSSNLGIFPWSAEECREIYSSAFWTACTADCVCLGCGDGTVQGGQDGSQNLYEECDDGTENSDTAPNACRANCKEAWCGDGVTDTGQPQSEKCDEGEENSDASIRSAGGSLCRTDCRPAGCGDGIQDPGLGELCDYGDDCSQGVCNRDFPPQGYSNWCKTNCQPYSLGTCCTKTVPPGTTNDWQCLSMTQEQCDEYTGYHWYGNNYGCYLNCHASNQQSPPGYQLAIGVRSGEQALSPLRRFFAFLAQVFGGGSSLRIGEITILFDQTEPPIFVEDGGYVRAVLHFPIGDETYVSSFVLPQGDEEISVILSTGDRGISAIEHQSGDEYVVTVSDGENEQQILAMFTIELCLNADGDSSNDCPRSPEPTIIVHTEAEGAEGFDLAPVTADGASIFHYFRCGGVGEFPLGSALSSPHLSALLYAFDASDVNVFTGRGRYFFTQTYYDAAHSDVQEILRSLLLFSTFERTHQFYYLTFTLAPAFRDRTLHFDCVSGFSFSQAPVCGDGIVSTFEACDDGNLIGEDGCSPLCTVEFPWQCVTGPTGRSVCSLLIPELR